MIRELEVVGQALSDPTRLRILKLLAVRDLCVCQLVYLLAASQSRVSQNLALLKSAGLVTDTRQGHLVFYALNRSAFEQAIANLQALVNATDLAGMPDMSGELKRWRDLPTDLAALCPPASDVLLSSSVLSVGEPAGAAAQQGA